MNDPKTTPDSVSWCEYDTDPLTHAELVAIARYADRTAGIPDSVDHTIVSADGYERAAAEYGAADVRAVIKSELGCLDEWADALTTLREEFIGYEQPRPLSVAAQRYLTWQEQGQHEAMQTVQHEALKWLLGWTPADGWAIAPGGVPA